MTNKEFSQKMKSLKPSKNSSNIKTSSLNLEQVKNLPESVDWRKMGAVTPVKDQGICGSSYAYAATAALESVIFRKTGKLVSLSEKYIMDCVYGAQSCAGGSLDEVFGYMSVHGILSNSTYESLSKCDFDRKKSIANILSVNIVETGSETDLKAAVALLGPVVAVIDAEPLQLYKGGILDDPQSTQNINHAIVVVGYGAENGRDFWIIKNSWGDSWGEKGYFRMARNKDNQCGIGKYFSIVTISKVNSE